MITKHEIHPLVHITGTQKLYIEKGWKGTLIESVAITEVNQKALHGYTEQDDFVASYIAIKNNIPIFSREKKDRYINGMYDYYDVLDFRKKELGNILNKMKYIPVTFFQYDSIVLGKDKKIILPEAQRHGDNSYINPKDINTEFQNVFEQKEKGLCYTSHNRVTSKKYGKKSIYEYKVNMFSSDTIPKDEISENSLKNSFIKETFNGCTSKQLVDKCDRYAFVVDGLNILHGCYHPTRSYRLNMEKIAAAYRKSHPEYNDKYVECLLVLRGPICDKAGFYPGGLTRDKIMKPFNSCRKLKEMKNKWSCKELCFNVPKAKVYVDVLYVWQTIEVPCSWAEEWRRTNCAYTIKDQALETIQVNPVSSRWKVEKKEDHCYTGVKDGYKIVSTGGGWKNDSKKKMSYLSVFKKNSL